MLAALAAPARHHKHTKKMAKRIEDITARQLRGLQKIGKKAKRIVGTEAKKHFRKSFREQGFTDTAKTAWEKRKNDRSPRDIGRAILVDSGNLRDSVEILRQTKSTVEVGSKEKYAAIHNEGLEGKAWGKHPFKMPKRQFVGNSAKLHKKMIGKLEKELKKALLP